MAKIPRVFIKKWTNFFLCVLGVFLVILQDGLLASQNRSKPTTRIEYVYHEVKKGESLEVIARRYGTSVEELKRLNGLKGTKLVAGQKLIVGIKREPSKEREEQRLYHVVKKGETLERIAKLYGVSKEEIKRLNNLKSEKLVIGQKLLIKDSRIERTSRPDESSKKGEYVYHEVKKGESLEVIARRYGTSVEELKRLNGLKGTKLVAGQKLIVGIKREPSKEREEQKREITLRDRQKTAERPGSEEVFKTLEERFKELSQKPRGDRREWLRLANEYRRFYLLYPGSPFASKAILRTGDIYYNAYKISLNKEDLSKAIECYRKIALHYPSSSELEEAYYKLAKIYQEEFRDYKTAEGYKEQLRQRFPRSLYLGFFEKPQGTDTPSPTQRKKISKSERSSVRRLDNETSNLPLKPRDLPQLADLKKVTDVSPITGTDYTRVIISLSGNFEYQTNILKGDDKNPPRIYVDIYPAVLDSKISREIELKDTHLKRVRVGQFDKNVVRVVLDLNSLVSYKIFKLNEPFQLVLDLAGKEKEVRRLGSQETSRKLGKGSKSQKREIAKVIPSDDYINLARQFGLGVRRIVIDPGHGGEDPGAVGPTGLKEKEVNLIIAKFLEKKLKETFKDMEVVLTRNSDYFIPLIKRPALANTNRGDIFISIHTNASPDPNARGIEVYYLNFTTDPEAMRVAALENAASDKSLSDLQDLVKAILSNTKLSESKLLAEKVHNKLFQTLSKYYPDTTTRGVKYAPFLVLVGTRMPAILVEVGFITNPIEEGRLKNQQYLELIAEGIAKGIEDYIQSLKFSQISR